MKSASFQRTLEPRPGRGNRPVPQAEARGISRANTERRPLPRFDNRGFAPRTYKRSPGEKGTVSLAVIFLFFIFSGLGLSMIALSQVHLKLTAWRKFSSVIAYASENGVKKGFRDLVEWARSRPPSTPLSEGQMEALRADPGGVLALVLDQELGAGFPRIVEDGWENMRWRSRATGSVRTFEHRDDCYLALADFHIESEGMIAGPGPRRTSSLDGTLGFLAGRLPLSIFPLLIEKDMGESEFTEFLAHNNASVVQKPNDALGARPGVTTAKVIPGDATPLVSRALKTRILQPQDLSTSLLRFVLGLEISEDPVPEGVYLIRDDIGLGGLFVQGDVDEMVMAIEDDSQVIVFRMEAGEWILKFSPSHGRTEFLTPAGMTSHDLVPTGIILINGKILSLGGGAAAPDGAIEIVGDREIPSVLTGVALTIVASDKITLSSHLILQNVRWQEGLPYIKDAQSQIVIFSTGRDFVGGIGREGGIEVDASAPSIMKVHASLTVAKGGFGIAGEGKYIELLGGLQAMDLVTNGNALAIVPDERTASGILPENVPGTAAPQVSIVSFRVLSWNEY